MKRLALAVAISATTAAANAAVVTSTFDGSFVDRLDGSGFTTGTYDPTLGSVSLDYSLAVDANFGAYVGSRITLNGTITTAGAVGVPKFAQQTFTFTDAVYTITGTGTSAVVPAPNPTLSYATAVGTVDTANDVGYDGDALQTAGAGNGALTGGTAVCTGGSCTSFDLNSLFALDAAYAVEFGTFIPQGSDVAINFLSTSGSTGYSLNSVEAVPVPAAAWLFGSALIGLAGIGRKRKIA
jgi:hypothetical protein